ncbi:MAG: peptidase M16, partial [Perlucidibaca sp.]
MHRVRLTLRPDTGLAARRDALEAERLAQIRAQLSADDLARLRDQAAALAARQAEENDVSLLPKVTLADVPAQVKSLAGVEEHLFAGSASALPLASYAQGTNGLVYQQLIVDLPALSARETSLLPLYTSLFSELGVGDADYRSVQQRQSAVSGGLRMSLSARTSLNDANQASAHLVISGKALAHNHAAFQQLLHDTFFKLRFDEGGRARDILAQLKGRWEGSVTGQGHALAMSAATRGFSALAAFQQRHSGLAGIRFLKQLHEQESAGDGLSLLTELAALHDRVLAEPRLLLL